MMDLREIFYRKMLLIRRTEEKIEELFREGALRGTTHGYIGEEAIAVGVLQNVNPKKDFITGGHRSHGHLLALSDDCYALFAELMGKETGLVNGRGGSQHIKYENFYTNGITGGMLPVAVGMAFSLKLRSEENIVVSFFGDGAMNEGYVMESFNLSGAFQLPNLFVLENNSYAMSTKTKAVSSGEFAQRVKGFGIDYHFLKALDVMEVYEFSKEVISKIRKDRKPAFIEFETHRFSGHSKSDKREYMPQEVDAYWRENDPLLKAEKSLNQRTAENIKIEIEDAIKISLEKVSKDNYPNAEREY